MCGGGYLLHWLLIEGSKGDCSKSYILTVTVQRFAGPFNKGRFHILKKLLAFNYMSKNMKNEIMICCQNELVYWANG